MTETICSLTHSCIRNVQPFSPSSINTSEHSTVASSLNSDFSQPKWVMCIRPTEEHIRALTRDVYACKYISFSLEEADDVTWGNALGLKLMERIDRELSSLGNQAPD
jgi:hypothetical protein